MICPSKNQFLIRSVTLFILSVAFSCQAFAQIDAQDQIEKSAEALGGLDKILSIRNMTLIGYGQWAYQYGGGNIDGDPNAPQKWNAANDLRRVYDLENDRFQILERRNYLFPFAGTFGHNFAQVNQIIDGMIGYNIRPNGAAVRIGDTRGQGSQRADSPRLRRLWMLSNPVTALRTAMDENTDVGTLYLEDSFFIVPLTTKENISLEIGFDPSNDRPRFVRWVNPQDNMGQLTYTVWFTGYMPFSDVLLPVGYNAVLDWRNLDYMKMYVDNYLIDTEIEDLTAPAVVLNTPEPVLAEPEVESEQVADNIWRLSTGTTVYEFADHLVLYEMYGSQLRAKASIDYANQLIPGKRATHAIVSHHHSDHTGGFRAALAAGLTIISHRDNEGILREWAERRAPDFPDLLEQNWHDMNFIPVDEHLRLADDEMTLDIYWGRENIHTSKLIFAYAPQQKVLSEADMATAAFDYQWWGDNLFDVIDYYELDVETFSPVHFPIMNMEETVELVRGGVERARERCAAELGKGNYFAGCPVQSDRF